MNPRVFQPRAQGAFPWPHLQSQGKAPWGQGCMSLAMFFFSLFFNAIHPHHVCREFRWGIDCIVDFHLSSISKFWMISSSFVG